MCAGILCSYGAEYGMAGMAAYGMPVRAQCQPPAPASPSRINPGSAIDPALCCVLWKAYGQAPVAPAPMKSQMPATPNSTTLFVANLTRTATEAEMHAVFGGCAPNRPTNHSHPASALIPKQIRHTCPSW